MTQKAKGPVEAATSPSQVQSNPSKGSKNMETHSISDLEVASIHRVKALSKEISAELNNIEDNRLVIIYPANAHAFPVQICLDKEFADLLKMAMELRKGASNDQPCR